MIGPVSGTGRAMMASLQQAIQKGMPPDQAIQYVKSMATQGVAPLADLYAMLNQFQRLKQQPVQAPQTPPTIRDQLNMMEQQQAMMQQGVASLPAPVMDQAQFAGGGIVAFQDGGEVNPISYMQRLIREALARGDTETAEEIRASLEDYTSLGRNIPLPDINLPTRSNLADLREERFRQQQGMAPAAAAPSPTAPARPRLGREATGSAVMFPGGSTPAPTAERPAPPRDDTTPRPPAPRRPAAGSPVPDAPRVAAEAPAEKKMTLEDFMAPFREAGKPLREATEEYRRYLASEEASAKEQSGRDRMLALAQAGFGMAQAASKPGATFLGSVGAAGGDFAKTMMQLNREADAAKRGIVKERLALAQAEASGNKADIAAASQDLNNYENRLIRANEFKQEISLRHEGLAIQRAELALRNTGLNAEIARAAARDARDDREYSQRINEFMIGARIKVAELAREEIADLIRTPTYMDATPEVQEQMIQDVNNRIALQVFGGSGTGVGTGSSNIKYLGSRPSGK